MVLLLLLLLMESWFVFEEGMKLGFFPPVWGIPSSSGSPRTSPLDHLFWADPGPGPPLSNWWWWWWLLKLLLLLLHFLASRAKLCYVAYCFTGPTSWSSPLYHHNHLPVPTDQGLGDGFKAIPRQAQPEGVIPVGCPCRGSEEVNHPVVSTLALILFKFAAFAYNVTNRFITL